ncbi:MAG: GNAT family N-acetyltransferase [Dehalococcoidales bacterium]|nr:GNAT family N-acetyltransferase [Dehalococcoidales bacterium]
MGGFPYSIRNYQPGDFGKFVQLTIEAEKLEPAGRFISEQAIARRLGRPNYSPERDLFLASIKEKPVGYLDITSNLGIGRVIFDCWVHPEHRRQGISTQLLNRAFQRARELGAKVAHVNISQEDVAARSVLPRFGFECVRRFLELKLDMTKVPGVDTNPPDITYRHLQPGEEEILTQIQNRAFAGTWGYNPNTVEETKYFLESTGQFLEDVILLFDEGKVIGYCWTKTLGKGGRVSGKGKGRLFMLGVDPDYRGMGAGKLVLLVGLAHLKEEGLETVELTVDSENEVAVNLYQSVGFEIETRSFWYEKVIDTGEST